MITFVSLLKREWLEHKAAFVWGPAILLVLMLLFGLTMVAAGDNLQVEVSSYEADELLQHSQQQHNQVSGLRAAGALLFDVSGSSDRELAYQIKRLLSSVATPFYWILLAITLFALIASLHDERKDQSILFWKSMPVSDVSTVLSKLVFCTWVAPLVTILVIVLAQLAALALATLLVEPGAGARLWAQSEIWWWPLQLGLGFVLHGLWILPVYAWFLLLAAALPKAPMLWAIGLPWIAVVLERIFFNSEVLVRWISLHMTPLAIPGVSSNELAYNVVGDFLPLAVFSSASFWSGLLVALVLLGLTVYIRGKYNEL